LGYGRARFPFLSPAESPFGADIGEKESARPIDPSAESGVVFFDSARVCRGGGSEVIMGNALKLHNRSDCFIGQKMPTLPNSSSEEAKNIFATQSERLQTEHFDYWLPHGVTSSEIVGQTREERGMPECLPREKAYGRIRDFGFSFQGTGSAGNAFFSAESIGRRPSFGSTAAIFTENSARRPGPRLGWPRGRTRVGCRRE
jgi:predicted aldo/keto reductase-like oxidoreductase